MLKSQSHFLACIYPRLLPLVAQLPPDDLKYSVEPILEATKMGLKTFVVVNNRSMSQTGASSCVASYFEVALYAMKNCGEVNDAVFHQVNIYKNSSLFF